MSKHPARPLGMLNMFCQPFSKLGKVAVHNMQNFKTAFLIGHHTPTLIIYIQSVLCVVLGRIAFRYLSDKGLAPFGHLGFSFGRMCSCGAITVLSKIFKIHRLIFQGFLVGLWGGHKYNLQCCENKRSDILHGIGPRSQTARSVILRPLIFPWTIIFLSTFIVRFYPFHQRNYKLEALR